MADENFWYINSYGKLYNTGFVDVVHIETENNKVLDDFSIIKWFYDSNTNSPELKDSLKVANFDYSTLKMFAIENSELVLHGVNPVIPIDYSVLKMFAIENSKLVIHGSNPVMPFEEPFPQACWYLSKDKHIIHIGKPVLPFKLPFPQACWHMNEDETKVVIGPSVIRLINPYPLNFWYYDETTHSPEFVKPTLEIGSFCYASNLKQVKFPRNIKKIGDYAFRFTDLDEVTLPIGCEYSDTSFPDKTIISFDI